MTSEPFTIRVGNGIPSPTAGQTAGYDISSQPIEIFQPRSATADFLYSMTHIGADGDYSGLVGWALIIGLAGFAYIRRLAKKRYE